MRYDRPRYVGIVAGIFGVMLTWLMSQYNYFEILDYTLYDTYIKHRINPVKSSKNIILIDIETDERQYPNWIQFLENIENHHPEQIRV